MTLMGSGVLAIWNGVAEGTDAEFLEWHVLEHIPERVGVPGFLRGRRYVAEQGHPLYFNFYETEAPEVLTSAAYLGRLDAPTDWTRRVIASFRDTIRTVCRVRASLGRGDGSYVETVRLAAATDAHAFAQALGERLLPAVLARPGIVAVHLLEGLPSASNAGSAEKKLRGAPDQVAAWILLVEGVDRASLEAARAASGGDGRLRELGASDPIERGIYRLEFGLDHTDLGRGPVTAPKRWASGT